MEYFRAQLSSLAAKHGERLLDTTNNPISLGQHTSCTLALFYLLNNLFVDIV